jgi:hypothetical protein
MQLYREAAELGNLGAMFCYAQAAYAEIDCDWGESGSAGCASRVLQSIRGLLQSFQQEENGRILHTVASTVGTNCNAELRSACGTIVRARSAGICFAFWRGTRRRWIGRDGRLRAGESWRGAAVGRETFASRL